MDRRRDVFICHASEDKDSVARPLRDAFVKAGITCWFDEDELEWGDDIAVRINDGLAVSRYVVLILSTAIFKKNWQQTEMFAALNQQASSGDVRICPLLVGLDSEVNEILEQYPLLAGKRYFRWERGVEAIVKAMIARLSRAETSISDLTKRPLQAALLKSFGAVIFAAGKNSRMEIGHSKMLLNISHRGQFKPMLFYVIDIFSSMHIPTLVLVGFDGDSIQKAVENEYGRRGPKCLVVSKPDGSDLEKNTGGTLKKFSRQISDQLPDAENILFCVGDQPFMRTDTMLDFILDYAEKGYPAGLLAADSRGTPLQYSSSTRIAKAGDKISFDTPSKDRHFEHYSTLLDVGVLIINRQTFATAVQHIEPGDVFSKLLYHLPQDAKRIYLKIDSEPSQFNNVNDERDIVPSFPREQETVIDIAPPSKSTRRSRLLLDWLDWNINKGRRGEFRLFSYVDVLDFVGEVDTTLICQGTLGCALDCTYNDKHMEEFLNPSVAKYALRRARELGYTGVLFSGGGENLEPAAYDNFLGILKYAKEEIGLRTNLATNGLYLSQNNALVLARLLDTVRFSVSPTTQDYCHAGVIAPNIVQFRKAVDLIRQQSDDYVPTKIYANILMSPDMRVEELEAILRMFSQIGVDAIRLKPKHEKLKGVFTIRPAAYSKLLTRIAEITKDSSLRLPKVTVAKLPRLLEEDPGVNIAPSACWYRDFNPFVLGCNSRIYACCEMKYENNGFDLGEVVPGQDNLWSLLSPRQRAQPIVPGRCFKGCKGYQVNRDLEYLLRGYAAEGAAIFDSPLYATVRDRVLENIPRDALTN